ncbi:3-hydroxybenzoate-6-hydroxylase [Burkholderia sp. YI23]|nr:3-hydroxybenzoate-6-hydroxylase [Burkholderia sp. YI23]
MLDVTHKAQPVLIVGGGIGGLAAALALAAKGRSVHLLEQAAEFREIGAGIQLGPNVFRMFDRLGVTDAVKQLAAFPSRLVMMDALSGEEVTGIALGDAFVERFSHPYALIHRSDLHSVLANACAASPLIRMTTAQKVTGFEELEDRIVVTTHSGGRYEGAALIGADGLWSSVRQWLVNDGKPRVSGHIAYRGVLPIEQVPEHLRSNTMTLWAGPKNHLVHYPLRGGKLFNLVAVFHSDRYDEGWDTRGDPEELHRRFEGTQPQVQELLSRVETWRMWVLCDRDPIKAWSRGRVTLLGDAAHPMLQYMAQGACMAVEDAVCLADRIEANGDDVAQAFKSYERERYLRTGRTQLMARLYGEVYHASGVARELRNNMLRGRTSQQAYDSLEWLYGETKTPLPQVDEALERV